jgi:hypothetical protein
MDMREEGTSADDFGLKAGRFAAFFLLAAMWAGQAIASTVGVFQFVAGDVRVILAAGSERAASKGSPVSLGDTVATGRDAVAQIKMGDGAILVVQPQSRLTVAEFHYTGKADGTEKVRFRLEQGGFRSVTGAIGHTHEGSYLIETPIAHIGVRGTDHETYHVSASGAGEAAPARAGTYNKVNTGLTFIRTQTGEVEVRPNQVGFVASAQDTPGLLPAIPEFFNRAVEPRSAQRGGPASADALQPAARQIAAPGPQVIQTVTTAGGANGSTTSGGSGTTAGGISLTTPAAGTPAGGGGGSTTGVSGEAVGYTRTNGGGNVFSGMNPAVAATANGATPTNTGSDAAFAVNWGSWPGGLATVGGNATSGATHFIQSTNLTTATQLAAMPSSLVSATYNYAGGPPPTDKLGNPGVINSLSVGVNFSSQTITNYAVNATVGAQNWSASGSGSIANFTGASGISLSGNCSGCANGGGAPAANGSAHGAFVGSAADRMITSFGLKSAGNAMSGAAYLSR